MWAATRFGEADVSRARGPHDSAITSRHLTPWRENFADSKTQTARQLCQFDVLRLLTMQQ
jgi:hypothetical protein